MCVIYSYAHRMNCIWVVRCITFYKMQNTINETCLFPATLSLANAI